MRKKPAFYTAAISIGDIICSTPTVRKLAETYGEPVRVFTFVPELFEGLPYVSGVEDIREWRKDPLREKWLRNTYDLHQTFWKMGKKIQTSDGRGVEMRHSQMDIRQYHAIDLGFNLLPEEMHCDFMPQAIDMAWWNEKGLPEKYICLHASKTWNSRSWSNESWKDLCGKLLAEGIPVVLVGKDGMTPEEIEKYKSTFDGNVEDRLIDELSKKKMNALSGSEGIIDLTNQTDFSQLWHVLDNAQLVVTMDSGILHMAGTSKTNILQLGSSIHPHFRAPYRNSSQEYRYTYLPGNCKIHCASSMKYSLRDWEQGYNGATPIQSLSLVDTCLEKKPTFECHPSVDSTLQKCLEIWNADLETDAWEGHLSRFHQLSSPEASHPEYVKSEKDEFKVKFRVDWHDGGKLHVIGDERDPRHFQVSFYDEEEKELVHRDEIRTGYWTAPHWKDTRWKVTVESEGQILFESVNRKEDPVLIQIASGSLGDTIGALAVIERYREKTGKNVEVICNHRNAFKYSYPELKFHNFNTDPTKLKGKSFSEYHKIFYKFERPLMQGYADQLGVDITDIQTKIDKQKISKRPIKEKYVCFSMHSTAQAKHWNNEEGWQKLCELLKNKGLIPVCVDQYESFGADGWMNPVPRNARKALGLDLKETIRYIQHAEFFIGLSSGLSWVANAIGVPTVMISNVTSYDHEFLGENVLRITDESVCHGCFHTETFDSNDWTWCPFHKNTEKQFICSKVITPERVIAQIDPFTHKRGV